MAIMKTKQFQLIALCFKRAAEEGIDHEAVNEVADLFINIFAKDNGLFNEIMFRDQCGKHINQNLILPPRVNKRYNRR